MTAYVDRAIESLYAQLVAQFETELRTIETEDSLTANSIPDPEQYSKSRVPNWNASPLVQVYDAQWGDESSRSGIYNTTAAIILGYRSDADLDAGEKIMRQYITAAIRVIDRDPTLGGTVSQATALAGDSGYTEGDNSAGRMMRLVTVDIITHTPVACS